MIKRRRWLAVGVCTVAVVMVSVVRIAPGVIHGRNMEKFCTGVPDGLDRQGLTQMAEQQGYIVTPGQDVKGGFLRIDDDRSGDQYHCEARFKPDGKIGSMNFSARPKPKPK